MLTPNKSSEKLIPTSITSEEYTSLPLLVPKPIISKRIQLPIQSINELMKDSTTLYNTSMHLNMSIEGKGNTKPSETTRMALLKCLKKRPIESGSGIGENMKESWLGSAFVEFSKGFSSR